MGYAKVIQYGKVLEIYKYAGDLRITGKRETGTNKKPVNLPYIFQGGQNVEATPEPIKIRTKRSIRATVLAFRRIVAANLVEPEHPVFASFTYRENMESIGQGRKDFNAFARRARDQFGDQIKYIAVAEFQKRGAVHFHALVWGIPKSVVTGERHTRLVASLWGKGFADLVQCNDSSLKIASYMAKYMRKGLGDIRLAGKRFYITSLNIRRPVVDRGAIISSYWVDSPDNPVKLSTASVDMEAEYDTTWLGRCTYKKYIAK